MASSAYGLARTTLDADLIAVLSQNHVDPIVAALNESFYVSAPMIRSAIEKESSFNVIHLASMFKVDVFVAKSREFDQKTLSRIRKEVIGADNDQMEVFLASPEDVLLNKLEWYRLGAEISERQWNDVLGVLKVQHHALDLDYLREWASKIGVSDLLDRALTEANIE